MPHILKNHNLEIHIDSPSENYQSARFDRTGKISEVKFQNTPVTTTEKPDGENENIFGKGFYNEFGIDTALGFDEAEIGGWFHKIGIGLLKKDDSQYQFFKNYAIKAADFDVISETDRIIITCCSDSVNGYSYLLRKEVELIDSGFTIKYFLKNTGEKEIKTNEYVHNFTAINNDLVGGNYKLEFPFHLDQNLFGDFVNPENKLEIGGKEIGFNGSPKEQFFISYLNGKKTVEAKWKLTNVKSQIGMSETASFQTNKVNLWGWKHVISPELFYDISVQPNQSVEWQREYSFYKI
ncbi:MAG: hypothetical protein K9J12_13570 [Melioribacteraceae bacterium]|nr:hypothetical protein [Melioribacteraceae bacterium]MCF8263899.1 hypothetical protein [Melioribacteraceae bacterium]MCF8430304.1 hypothetical protein [Melioribacteraceae bacterium]